VFVKNNGSVVLNQPAQLGKIEVRILDGDENGKEWKLSQCALCREFLAIGKKITKHHALAAASRTVDYAVSRVANFVEVGEHVDEQAERFLSRDVLWCLNCKRVLDRSADRSHFPNRAVRRSVFGPVGYPLSCSEYRISRSGVT
jgi:hypothetical protein